MQIAHAVVHMLEKNQLEREIRTQLRADELPLTESVRALLAQVQRIYNTRSGRGYGSFQPDRFLTHALRSYLDGSTPFLDLSYRCMSELGSRVRETTLATGGYIIFVEYEHADSQYLMIAMLKSTPGVSFDEALEIMDVKHLDLDRLAFAARVNLSDWAEGAERYISFVKGRAADIASYFKEFIGVAEYTESSEDTQSLINALIDYSRELNYDEDAVDGLKARVHSYCTNKVRSGDRVYLEDLSRFIDEENPEGFLTFANERSVSDVIEIHNPALRRLIRYSGKDKDVSVGFNAAAFGTRVTYDSERDELTIKRLPGTLRAQLSQAR